MYELYLFVAGDSPKSARALANIQQIAARHLAGQYTLEVIDVQQHPEQAQQEGLIGVPMLLKKSPGLVRRLVGDLSDQERVLKALGIL